MQAPQGRFAGLSQEVSIMARLYSKFVPVIFLALLLMGCNSQKQVELQLKLSVSLEGKPAPNAQVSIDAAVAGATDNQGQFASRLKRLPGQEVSVTVTGQVPGYHIAPWKASFVTKLAKGGMIETYPFEVHLKAQKYITLAVRAGGEPVEDASVKVQNKVVGKSDAQGDLVYTYDNAPQRGFVLSVHRKGYQTWWKQVQVRPGDRYEVNLRQLAAGKAAQAPSDSASETEAGSTATAQPSSQASNVRAKSSRSTLTVLTQTDAYGVARGLGGVAVRVNGQPAGKTDARGRLIYHARGMVGQTVAVQFHAPGHIPEQWKTEIHLKEKQSLQHYFYPAMPAPIEVGIYGYINNSPGKDLAAVLEQVASDVRANLFLYKSFSEVPREKLREMMVKENLDMQTLSTKGWQHTPLIKTVDMIVSGSVTQDERGFTIETSLTTADGKILLSQINTARQKRDIARTAKVIVAGIIDQFPFEGAVAGLEQDGCRINLGTLNYKIRRGNHFRLMAAHMDRKGKILGYEEEGQLRVVKTGDSESWAQVVSLKPKQQIKVGDKVIRRIYLEEEKEANKAKCTLAVQGGTQDSSKPLWGVNVYLNNTWVGTTRANGQVTVPVHLDEQYDLLLSRHGYQPVQTTLHVTENNASKMFSLEVVNALFKVESTPAPADVYIDDVKIGQTPLLDGKLVNFGFRKVRLSAGGEYRDWSHVIEFNTPEVAFTGARQIILMKDYYKIGQLAEQSNNIDAAIQAYGSIERQNPDYSDARCRLAQLYMDAKSDFDGAIREYENVLALPENKQIIFKQYAVTYTNLGHAYYEKGNGLIWTDKNAAAANFAKAIEELKIAKQNTRFFPTRQFNEAVHDTYYFLALSYHKLYLVTKNSSLLPLAKQAWREYFDFFPKQLEGRSNFAAMREAGRKYYAEIKDL